MNNKIDNELLNLPDQKERHKIFGSVEPGPRTKPNEKKEMIDIQSERKDFLFDIDSVGISNVKYPITINSTLNPTTQTSIATFDLTANIDKYSKGTNMSRFLEQINIYEDIGLRADFKTMFNFSRDLQDRLKQEIVYTDLTFPWFYKRRGPDSESPGMNHSDVSINIAYKNDRDYTIKAGMEVLITTLCPCSKEISEYSAHSQRGRVKMNVTFNEEFNEAIYDWKKDLLDAAESSSSAKIHPVLKRTDEKVVTETAYENPRFVEDIVRLVAANLYELPYIQTFSVTCENEESIHLHNAIATINFDKNKN